MMVPSARACATALRGAVLTHVRLAAPSATALHAGAAAVVGVERVFGGWRSLAEAAGTYLDRGEVAERVLGVVKNFQKVDPAKVSPAANFQKDLGLDSLDTVEVVMAIEEEFAIEIPDTDADKIASCDDAINYIASHPQAK